MRTRLILGAITTATLAMAGCVAAAQASTTPEELTFVSQLTAIQFFSNTGPMPGFPAAPLVPGDRIIGHDRIVRDGKPAGHDNEVCTVAFDREVLCQDIVSFDRLGDLQASWTVQWPATGNRGPSTFDGIISGGTSHFRDVHGSFHAATLPDGDMQITVPNAG